MPTELCTVSNNSATTSNSENLAADEVALATMGQMRRIASAPAFKHANAYQAPSPTAAVAEAQADAAAEAFQHAADTASARSSRKLSSKLSSKLFSWGSAAASGKPKPRRTRCSNCSGGCCSCLEVYVVSRPFTEFGGDLIKNLPQEAKDGMVDLGLCHYMTVFKSPDGQLVQFDFGPMGGDVQKAHGPLATFLRRAHAATVAQAGQQQDQQQQLALALAAAASDSSSSGRGMVHSPSAPVLPLASLGVPGEVGEGAAAALTGQPTRRPRTKGVAGEIRERQLDGLPSASLYMGRTQLSLSEIRQYNSLQGNMRYTLHDNDCRHYVNSLVQYATGVERSTQHMKRQYFNNRNADKWLWYGWFISATQLITDVGNWSHVQAGAAVTLLAVTGRSTLAQLKTLTLPIVPVITRSIPSMLPSSKAAAAAAAGGSAAAAGGIATTLKLPAGLLLKRPLAGSAVAAAGGAGAAAAAIRTVPMGHDGAVTAATAASSSSNGSSSRGFGVWGTPLRQWREGIGQGLRGAVLTVRRLAVRQQGIVIERLEPGAAARAAAAPLGGGASGTGGGGAARRGWFGRGRGSGDSRSVSKPQLAAAQVGAATAVVALPHPTAPTAVAPSRGRWRSSSSGASETVLQHVQLGTDYAGSSSSRNSSKGPKVMLGLGHHVGRHVLWLGSTAAKATSAIVVLASKQMGYFTHKHNIGAVAAQIQGRTLSMSHSSSSGNLLGQQQQQRTLVNQRSRSAPSLAVVAAAAAASDAAAAQYWDNHCPSTAPTATPAVNPPTPESFCFSENLSGGCAYTSSLVCSSVGGRSSGVGRQVLNLPAPRLSWGRRASHGVIVCK